MVKLLLKLSKEAIRYRGLYAIAILSTLILTVINLAAPKVLSAMTGIVSEGVDRLGDALEAEEVHEPGVAAAHDVVARGKDGARHVEAAKVIGNRDTHESGLAEELDRELHAGCARDRPVLVQRVADEVGLFRERGDAVRHDVAAEVDSALVVVDRVSRVFRREVVFLRELEVLFEQRRYFSEVEKVDCLLDILVVPVEIAHVTLPST